MEPDQQETIAKIQLLRGNVAISVDLSWCILDDAVLECLKGLPQLQTLDLSGTKVTDAGLEHLKGYAQLEKLALCGTMVTDAGLEQPQGVTGNSESWTFATPESPTPVWNTSRD